MPHALRGAGVGESSVSEAQLVFAGAAPPAGPGQPHLQQLAQVRGPEGGVVRPADLGEPGGPVRRQSGGVMARHAHARSAHTAAHAHACARTLAWR